ncbi:MAG: helix-turn-helix transcriptional regulator [Devosia sp.]|nr:helix-turn-helix transcriptional regulator [Devosia sp.]
MLALFERYLKVIHTAKSDAAIVDILRLVAADFGFRGGFLVEYGDPPGTDWRVLDTTEGRDAWWAEYFASPMVLGNPRFARLPAGSELTTFDATRFGPDEAVARDLATRGDLLDATLAPLGHEGKIVGALGLRGKATLEPQQQTALQFIAYNLLAQFRAIHGEGMNAHRAALTRREREVIRLSAEGMTSQQIAVQLGMSARTANQHFDNVADKLGTRNRAHTVAEVIRRGLLD